MLKFNEKATDIFRRWYVDGRLYYNILIDKNPKNGIAELRPIEATKIKKVVEDIKMLRGIAWGIKLPGKPKQLKANATEKEREQAAKVNNYRVSRETAHYWAQAAGASFERRVIRQPDPDDQE